jgi:hypothetical protein
MTLPPHVDEDYADLATRIRQLSGAPMHISHSFSVAQKMRAEERPATEGGARRKGPDRPVFLAAAAAVALLLTACGGAPSSVNAVVGNSSTSSATPTPTPTPTPTSTPIAKTPCPTVASQSVSAGTTYICTKDEAGKLIWLTASESRDVNAKVAAAAAAKAAAEKAAAEKAAAEKAAADKAATDAAAAEAARAAEVKAAQEAAAARAAAEEAARAAAPPPPQNVAPPPSPAPPAPPAPSGCDPNYSGCVPIASDVDCAGGSGNGPAYVQGPVRVIGSDIYGLDNDKDGIGCEG